MEEEEAAGNNNNNNVCSSSRINYAPRLEDVPELIYRIQSLLPAKEAARTCVLSKSWLNAWSTIPTLTFTKPEEHNKLNYMKLVRRTFQRYFLDNIKITSLDIYLPIENQKSACLAKYWIQFVVSKSCLNKLSLTISTKIDHLFTLPSKEIFSSENLITLSIKVDDDESMSAAKWFKAANCLGDWSVVIKCENLRVLELVGVQLGDTLLINRLFYICTLLEKITLADCATDRILSRIMVKNLRHLTELKITSKNWGFDLETDDLPSLRLFCYHSSFFKPPRFNMVSLANVTELILKGVILDNNAFFDTIKSKFHFLETLNLDMDFRYRKALDITCASLKKLKLRLRNSINDIQIDAPKLLCFCYRGNKMPRLLFKTAHPQQIKLRLKLENPINEMFFINLREALDQLSSSKFYIDITIKKLADLGDDVVRPLINFQVDDLIRRRVNNDPSHPSPNVQQLSLKTTLVPGLKTHPRFIDALLTICDPMTYAKVLDHDQLSKDNYYNLCKVMVTNGAALTKETSLYLKNVKIKNSDTGKWETSIESSWRGSDEGSAYEVKLNWCSQRVVKYD